MINKKEKTISKKVKGIWYNFCGKCNFDWHTVGSADKCCTGYFGTNYKIVLEEK